MSSLAVEANEKADNRAVFVDFIASPHELFLAIFEHLVEDAIETARREAFEEETHLFERMRQYL
jgi:hypothetical protein